MDPSDDGDVRRHRRARNRYLGACLLCLGALCVLVGGVITGVLDGSLSSSDRDFFAGSVVLFVLFAVPAVFLGRQARYWHRQARARSRTVATAWAAGRPVLEPARWLPSGPGDPTALPQSKRIALVALRNTGITGLFLLVLLFGWFSTERVTRDSQNLLDHGTRVTATVIGEYSQSKGDGAIYVLYPAGGTLRTAKIRLDEHPFEVGDTVTVIYDPADPGRVRTAEAENLSDFQLWLGFVPLLAGLTGTLIAGAATVGWFRRYCAVRRTGWHPASVVVDEIGRIFVTYADRSHVELGGVLSV
ncbi:hypothetical protein FNH07_31615, partial [Amycolatopsis bartoniae]